MTAPRQRRHSTYATIAIVLRPLLVALLIALTAGPMNGTAEAKNAFMANVSPSHAATVATVASSTSLPGTVVERVHAGSASPDEINRIVSRFLVYGNAHPALYEVDWYRIRYITTEENGAPLEIVARVFVPVSAQPTEFPVYVFGPGTTGIGDHCAPSMEQPIERSWGDFQAHLLSYAALGHIAVMPDYAGFNDVPRPHYYYIKEMHARVMLDAARAALKLPDVGEQRSPARAANAIFFAGYSQGGHAAYAARDVAQEYAPDLVVKGVLSFGGRGDVKTLFHEFPSLGPYLLYAYQWYFGEEQVKLDQILLPGWLPTFEADVIGKCIDTVIGYYGNDPRGIYHAAFVDALEQGRLGETFPEFANLLERNSTGNGGQHIPVLILQGLADHTVEPETQEVFVNEVCAAGGTVTYKTYPGIPHVLTRQVSYRDTLDWMGAILRGEPPLSSC